MSERMTDERLAEIERAVFDVEGWPVNCSEELLQALKAERAEVARLEEERDDLCAALSGQTDRAVVAEAKLREANAEIERQQGLVRNYLETIEGSELDIAGLLEKLRAVGELPKKWMDGSYVTVHGRQYPLNDGGYTAEMCADELEALLK